jgi:transcriptional regulator with XRE-family HTH domain
MSQLALATSAEVSQRHISFVESGRSTPSRELLLHLARSLDIPLRDQNTLLTAAGYAKVFTEYDYDDPDLAPLRAAITTMLDGVDPYPAMAIDRLWNVRQMNNGAATLFAALVGPDVPISDQPNLVQLVFHPDGMKNAILNWGEVATMLLDRLEREALLRPNDEALRALRDEALASPGVDTLARRPIVERPSAFSLDLEITTPIGDMRFFTTMASIGAPTDATAEELTIEFYFPADAATEALVRKA